MRCVLKLGGGILQDEESYRRRAQGIELLLTHSELEQLIVVVSARKGRTSELVQAVAGYDTRECSLLERELKEVHGDLPENDVKRASEYDTPLVASYLLQGEIDSAYELAGYLSSGTVLEQNHPTFPLIGNSSYLCGEIDIEATRRASQNLDEAGELVVLSGFGCIDHYGNKMLLGSNATDYSAAIIAAVSGAHQLIYLKDVDGVYSRFGTDEERKIEEFSLDGEYLDVGEVVHPKVARPLYGKDIDVRVGHVDNLIELAQQREGYGTRIIV